MHGVEPTAPLPLQLKVIDMEYHSCLNSGQSSKADHVMELYQWKSKQASQEGAAAQKAADEESPLGQAYLKYMDALACDEAKALFNFHEGRMIVVQGNYNDAVKRLETSLNWNVNHQLSNAVYDNIVDDHRNQDPNWLNTDITKWGTSYLEVAKCFIGTAGYKDKLTIQDVDCSGLLHIIINNKAFESSVTKADVRYNPLPSFIKAREHRNFLFHVSNMEITDDQLKDMLANMILLLHFPGILDNGDRSVSVQKLQKLRDVEIFISLRDEIEIQNETIQRLEIIRKESMDEIEQSKQDLLDKVKDFSEYCESHVTALNDGKQTTHEKIGNPEEDLKATCANLEEICKDLEHRQMDTQLSLSRLQTAIGDLTTRCDETDLKQKAIEKQILELSIKIPKTEHAVSMIKELAHQHSGKLNYLQRKNELQKKFCGYYKRCLSTIPVSPVLKTISGTVDEVFVELSICEGLGDRTNGAEEEQVLLYKDILLKNNDHCKSVYLLGNAGMGKTTWCKKVLSTWVNACERDFENTIIGFVAGTHQQCNTTNTSEIMSQADQDEKCLRQFDLLFYIALRQQTQHLNIVDMIKEHPVVTEYSLQSVVDELLRDESHVCLILLDGLDEWTPQADAEIPGRVGLHGCSVVTTSRPYRLVGIQDDDDTFHADRFVRMTGVRDKELLVKKVIKQLNSAMKKKLTPNDLCELTENDYKKFIKEVKEMKDREMSYHTVLPGYMNIPLMLIIMVCLWFDKGKFENTITKNIGSMIEFIINYAEGITRGLFKRKKTATGKLEGISNLNELKEEWSKFSTIFPSSLSKKTSLKGYSELIFKVSYLAFQSLFNSEHNIQLTFSQDDLLQYFNEEELRVIVKIGILSQSEVAESPLCPMTKLSFIHKVFHEYLAGVYITIQFNLGKSEKVEMLQHFFRDPVTSNLSDIDNAACYVGGIDPVAGSKMSVYLFKGLTLEISKSHVGYLNTFYLRQVQVVHENDENYPSEEHPIYTEYIYVPNNLAQEKMKYLQLLFDTNITHLKHAEMPCSVAVKILVEITSNKLPNDFSLCVYEITPGCCDSLSTALRCLPKLQKISLHGLCKDSSNISEIVNLDLTGCSSLKHLSSKDLSNIAITGISESCFLTTDRDNADNREARSSAM